jgi:hypothetical protein
VTERSSRLRRFGGNGTDSHTDRRRKDVRELWVLSEKAIILHQRCDVVFREWHEAIVIERRGRFCADSGSFSLSSIPTCWIAVMPFTFAVPLSGRRVYAST